MMMLETGTTRRGAGAAPRRAALGLVAATALLAAPGCQTGGLGPLARWRMAADEGLATGPTLKEAGTEDQRNLLARWMTPRPPKSSLASEDGSTLVLGSDGWSPMKGVTDPKADAELAAATTMLDQNKLAEAEKALGRIAKRRKGSRWGEKAQFQLAESLFRQKKLTSAHEAYEKLLVDYTGTQFLDQAVAREMEIADTWLAGIDPRTPSEKRPSLGDRWRGTHPTVDTGGNALAVLEHVRHHDPTGPLADDAVLKIADYHLAQKNWDEAAIYYDQLISDHPKSPFLERALLSSVDAKLKGYLGPDYDGAGLESARKQILQVQELFPERLASYSDDLDRTLARIDEQMAERAFHTAEHYLWTGKVTSAEYCFAEIPTKWPKSPYARQAKDQLAHIATLPRKEVKASRMMTQPGGSDPLTGAPGVAGGQVGPNSGMMGANGMGMGGP
jgi:outer membrane protein assembly factor BamD (BamD/ComL family)